MIRRVRREVQEAVDEKFIKKDKKMSSIVELKLIDDKWNEDSFEKTNKEINTLKLPIISILKDLIALYLQHTLSQTHIATNINQQISYNLTVLLQIQKLQFSLNYSNMYFPCSNLRKNTHPSTPINSLRQQLNHDSSSEEEEIPIQHYPPMFAHQPIQNNNPEDHEQKQLQVCIKLNTRNQQLKELIESISKEIEKQSEESLSIMKNIKQMGQQVSHWQRGYFDITKSILGIEEKIVEKENCIRDEKFKKQYKQLDPKQWLHSNSNANTCKQMIPSYNSVTSENHMSQQSLLSSKKLVKTHENSRHCPTPQKSQKQKSNKYDTPIKQIFLKESSDKKYKKITPKTTWEFQESIPPLFSPERNMMKQHKYTKQKDHFDPKIRNKSANSNSNNKILERKKIFVHDCFDRKKLSKKFVKPFI